MAMRQTSRSLYQSLFYMYLSFSDKEMHSIDSTESNKSLKHELGLIFRSSLLPMSSWLRGIIFVSWVSDGGSRLTFYKNILQIL